MTKSIRNAPLFALAILLVAGCSGSDDDTSQTNPGTDAGVDAQADTNTDAPDTGADASNDANAEAATDAADDGQTEAATDAADDGQTEAATDAADDGQTEAATDAADDGQAEAATDAMAETGTDAGGTPNYMFVSSVEVAPSTLGGLTGADGICQGLAEAAGLPGNYMAWLSKEGDNAVDRLQATGARGWVRPDGLPFADSLSSLTTGQVFYPPRIDEEGNDVGVFVGVVTGTSSQGEYWSAFGDCDGYTDTTGQVAQGVADTGTVTWTLQSATACSIPSRLYCFGVDHDTPVEPAPVTGRLAFVTQASFLPGGGLAAADALCETERATGGLTGSFLALLATETSSAASRFDASGSPWFRVDGVQIAQTTQALLTDGNVMAGIHVTANGDYLGSSASWTGFDDITSVGAQTCASWTSTSSSDMGQLGHMNRSSYYWHNSGTASCDITYAHVYCLQE